MGSAGSFDAAVKRYMETNRDEPEYRGGVQLRHYTKQRLELLELEMKSLFERDEVKWKGLAEFM